MAEETLIKHDGPLNIAVGKNRREINWKNREWQWSDLVKKLSTTHRTAETITEYLAANRARQDEIKDIGGFVGGYLSGGRRKAGNVSFRQIITLDLDHATSDVWDSFTLLYGNAAALYTTHKHTPQAHRYRLLIPLDREVQPDEYEAISRRLAGNLGISLFDHTTFEPSRLMYWPSTAKDGEYIFEYQDGEWLSADEVLSTYRDWRDTSEWPVSERIGAIVKRHMQKQGDPLEKPGIIGAFCRTYGIRDVIEKFLSDVYDTTDIEGRYTYKEGSTAAGLVVYDDKFAFSHHGTDPTSGKLCNAFDLVRIHRFGLQDDDAKTDTPNNKLPSYVAMQDFAAQDKEVRKLLGVERMKDAANDFGVVETNDDENEVEWMDKLDVDRKGNYYPTIDNIVLILENDSYFKGKLGYDDFERCEVALKDLPWRSIDHYSRRLVDKDDANIRHFIEKKYGIHSALKVKDALDIVMDHHRFHPVRDYLNALEWDGEERLETLFIDYMGAEDNLYTRVVTKKALVAAVARVYAPGTKFDHVTVLVGPEAAQKSTILRKLGKTWFSDSFNFEMLKRGKEAAEQLQGVWIIEIPELKGFNNADDQSIKNFITKESDIFRISYDKRISKFERQCVFFGSSNEQTFLRNNGGDRRFWPIQVLAQPKTKDLNKLVSNEVDQVWAEAVELFRKGEQMYLTPEIELLAKQVRGEHTQIDDRQGTIERYLDVLLPENWDSMDIGQRRIYLQGDELQAEGKVRRDTICVVAIWCEVLGGSMRDINGYNTKTLHHVMQNMKGWQRAKSNRRFSLYGLQKAYERIETFGKASEGIKPAITFSEN